MSEPFLRADWPAPPNVHCLVTTRDGGVSRGPFGGFNLAAHVGDDAAAVQSNRHILRRRLGPAMGLQWISQVHGNEVFVAAHCDAEPPRADAIYTRRPRCAIGVLTADCLPVALCSRDGSEVAVAHAGWRGLAGGVVENTLKCFAAPPGHILAWLGPAIGPCHFEVGEEVRKAFLDPAGAPSEALAAAFQAAGRDGKWMADLYGLARARLAAAGVTSVYGGGRCTYCEAERFYSYRREPRCGRLATLIHLN